MNEMIFETVVTTCAVDGTVHVAPMGVRYEGSDVILLPFRPSTTLANIEATGLAVLNRLTDVRVFAGCVTGRRGWPTVDVPTGTTARRARAVRLATALSHLLLELVDMQDDPQRPRLRLACRDEAAHAPFIGINRAQAAVVEGAVLVSRLHMLPSAKVDTELAYLQIAIDKTAGPDEHEAWGWLLQAVAAHRAAAAPGGAT